jgi:hypothetical protein
MFCWVFALHTVCSACSGSVKCFANLSEKNVVLDLFRTGEMEVSEVIVDSPFFTKTVEIPTPSGFTRDIPPGEAVLLQICDYWPKYSLSVGEDTVTSPIESHHNIRVQVSGNIIVTTVHLVRVVANRVADQFPPAVSKLLPHADKAIFVEDKGKAMVLNMCGEYPCYYSLLLIQKLQRQLAEASRSKEKALVTRTDEKSRQTKHERPPNCQVS